MSRPTLDGWIAGKLGGPFTRAALEAYQLEALNETLAHARQNSRFYRDRLPQGGLPALSALSALPLTEPAALYEDPYAFLCVSPRAVERIVSTETSGSGGKKKRVFFTAEDLELCVDFFDHGMRLMVDEGDRVGILFPAAAPASVGDQLAKGLTRLGAAPLPLFDLVGDLPRLAETIRREGVRFLAGFPTLLAALAEAAPDLPIRGVLLSADYVSPACRELLRARWGAELFEHYGMTEMGLGGAVSCEAHRGCHIREADLLFEIVDPVTGAPLPPGERGEIVFTTLTRRATPLIRYRTGDFSRFLPGPCPCGTALLTLDWVGDRGIRKRIPIQGTGNREQGTSFEF